MVCTIYLAANDLHQLEYVRRAKKYALSVMSKISNLSQPPIEQAEDIVRYLKKELFEEASKFQFDFWMSTCWGIREASYLYIFDRTNPWIEFYKKQIVLTLAHTYLSVKENNKRKKKFSLIKFVELMGLAEQVVLISENITKAKVLAIKEVTLDTILYKEIEDKRLTSQYAEWEMHIRIGPIEEYEIQNPSIKAYLAKEKLSDDDLISSTFDKLQTLLHFRRNSLHIMYKVFTAFADVPTAIPIIRRMREQERPTYIYLIPREELVLECKRQGILQEEFNVIIKFFSVRYEISHKMLELKPILQLECNKILVGAIDWIQTVFIIERMIFLGNYHKDFFGATATHDIESFYNRQRKQYSRLMSFKVIDILISKRRFTARKEGDLPVIDREKIGKVHIRDNNNQKLGDLDVCVFDNKYGEILIFECKYLKPNNDIIKAVNLEARLTARDLDKIAQRVEWVERHLCEVMKWIGVTHKNPSRVCARCIVLTARPIYVNNVPNKIKIVSYGTFHAMVESDGTF